MSKSRVIVTVAVLLIFGVSVGILAGGLMNPVGAQDDLEGRRALLQKDESVPQVVGPAASTVGGGVSGIAANESHLFVVQGGVIHQFDAESLELVKQAAVGFGLTGGPKPLYATPVKKIRIESPSKPVSGKMEQVDEDDADSGDDEGDEGGSD